MKKINKKLIWWGYFSKRIVFLFVGLILILLIGTSYALWQLTFRQVNENIVMSDCFKVEFTDNNNISLNDIYPIEDDTGKSLTPYNFTITNICNNPAKYQVNLEVLNQTTLMDHSNIKVMYNEDIPIKLTEYESVDYTINDASSSYKLGSGYLEGNQSKSFDLRLWLDSDTPLSDDTMNKTFLSKVTVTTSYAKSLPGTIRTVSKDDMAGMWEYKGSITKLVIQNRLRAIGNAIKVSDESEEGNKSIMSYVVANEDGSTYTAYLQGQDVIYLNSDSSYLFYLFASLKTIEGMEYLNMKNVTNMGYMFFNCSRLTSLDLSNFDTSYVENMQNIFANCYALTNLDIGSFDTSRVTNMSYMFASCYGLKSIDISNFNTSRVTDMSFMFSNFHGVDSLDLSSFDTSNVTDMTGMFRYIILRELDLSNFDTSKVTKMGSMFSGCSKLRSLNLSSFDTSNVTDMASMFEECRILASISLSNFNTASVTSMLYMFNGCECLTELDLSNFDTSKVTNMSGMFRKCNSLKSLNLSSFDTSSVETMGNMFNGCSSLITLNLNSFNTSKVKDMTSMFENCKSLTNLNLSHFNTSNVNSTERMFYSCSNLITTITIMNNVTFYMGTFFHAAAENGAKIIVNYTIDAINLVDEMIATRNNDTSNVIKGRLVS